MINSKVLCIFAISAVIAGCSNSRPDTVVEKKMIINEETGLLEEKKEYKTIVYSSDAKKMPKLVLPKKQ